MDLLTQIFTIIGTIINIIAIILVIFLLIGSNRQPRIRSNTILEIDFEKGLIETYPDAFIYRLTAAEPLQIRNVIGALNAASKDKRIKGIIAHIAGGPLRYADVQEIRDAIINFRKTGKPAYAFAETFGEGLPGNSAFYLASSFDSIFLQPTGSLGLTGILSESPFFKGTLDKLDIKPQLGAREEYKTARNQFTESSFTEPHREMNLGIINSVLDIFIKDVAVTRKLDESRFRSLIEEGPLNAEQALKAGLVDALQYRDQVYDLIRQKIGPNTRFLYLSKYIQRIGQNAGVSKKAVALIYGDGAITQGYSRFNPISGEPVMGAKTIAAAFRAAVKDKSVGAIIFRVNSPGGSHIGSDIIWRETIRARKAGKPVIVTMGAVAGSGGYFVAMNANKIIAHPSTITGSIGVVSGKFVTGGLYNKLGITTDHVSTSPNATLWSPSMEYSEKQWQYIQQTLDEIYKDFMNKVAAGRNLSIEKVKELAKGRVYTGAEALRLGLVDTLGGFTEAFAAAKGLMGIPSDRSIPIKRFPKKPSFWERVFSKGPESSEDMTIEHERAFLSFNNPIDFKKVCSMFGYAANSGILHMKEIEFY